MCLSEDCGRVRRPWFFVLSPDMRRTCSHGDNPVMLPKPSFRSTGRDICSDRPFNPSEAGGTRAFQRDAQIEEMAVFRRFRGNRVAPCGAGRLPIQGPQQNRDWHPPHGYLAGRLTRRGSQLRYSSNSYSEETLTACRDSCCVIRCRRRV